MPMPPVADAPPAPGAPPPVLSDKQITVRNQITYYFSDANLSRDNYLRCLMDADGWVPLMLLARSVAPTV